MNDESYNAMLYMSERLQDIISKPSLKRISHLTRNCQADLRNSLLRGDVDKDEEAYRDRLRARLDGIYSVMHLLGYEWNGCGEFEKSENPNNRGIL